MPCFLAPQQLGSFEELSIPSQKDRRRRVALHDWSSRDPIPFREAWDWQRGVVEAHMTRLSSSQDSSSFLPSDDSAFQDTAASHRGVDTIVMLQHEPVYTLGTASDASFVLQQDEAVDVVRMDRGGEVTYHGPGQLVVYPLLDLRNYQQDIHWYVRALEEVVLRALHKAGVPHAERQDDVTGVWVANRKVAAVGIKCRRWITVHGLAINVEETSLPNFKGIVPCGLEGRSVGCVNHFLERPLTVEEFAAMVKEAVEEVFQVSLVPTS